MIRAKQAVTKRVFCMQIKYFIINWNEGVESLVAVVVCIFFFICSSHFPVLLLVVNILRLMPMEDSWSERWRLFIYKIDFHSYIHQLRLVYFNHANTYVIPLLFCQFKCQYGFYIHSDDRRRIEIYDIAYLHFVTGVALHFFFKFVCLFILQQLLVLLSRCNLIKSPLL